MKNKESRLPEDWFELAERDLNRVQIMLNEEDFADAAVHLQQALEKYLKGYLLSKGWELQRTHNLLKLLDYAVELDKSFEDFRDLCRRATVYYMIERHPFFISVDITEKEIKEGLEKGMELKQRILKDWKKEVR